MSQGSPHTGSMNSPLETNKILTKIHLVEKNLVTILPTMLIKIWNVLIPMLDPLI